MRKNLALVLALVMILSLLPMTAFAASTNTASRVPTVSKNADLTGADVYLEITQRSGSWTNAGSAEVFELELGEGAKWLSTMESVTSAAITSIDVLAGDKVAVVTVDLTTETAISIPMNVQLDDAPSGEQSVFIDGLDSVIDSNSVVYAVVEGGATVATATSGTLSGRNAKQVGSIRIQETVTGTLESSTQEFRLRLPKDFSWEKEAGTTANNGNGVTTTAISVTGAAGSNYDLATSNNGRDLTVSVDIGAASSRISIYVTPVIKAAKDASPGDVLVSLTSSDDISNQSGLKIATFKDFGYTIEVETDADDDEFVAGWRNDDEYVVTLTIEEDVPNTLFDGRYVDVELPSWVNIASSTGIYVDGNLIETADDDTDSFEFMFPTGTGAEEFDIVFTIVVSGTAAIEGPRDIVATIVGAGMDDEVVIGTAIPAITVEVEGEAILEVGTQKQMAPAIVVTENFPGALMEDGVLQFAAGTLFANSSEFVDFEVEVLEGDIELGDTETDEDYFSVVIDAESEEASVIRFYDIEITLDRTVPRGDFLLDVKGTAVVDAGNSPHENTSSRVFRIDPYFVVGTPVDGVAPVAPQITFTIGQSAYLVNGEMMMMDTAPFISEGRTMVPVKYLEELFGMAPIWNASSRTVTVMYEGKVYEMAIGSAWLKVNGANFMEMETPAMIVDDRTFVPLSRFAIAMGIDYTWDQATQTVVFN